MITIDKIFGMHFNGMHRDDITKEGMIKFAEDYAKLYHESEVKKLNLASINGHSKAFEELTEWCYANSSPHTDDELHEILERLNCR